MYRRCHALHQILDCETSVSLVFACQTHDCETSVSFVFAHETQDRDTRVNNVMPCIKHRTARPVSRCIVSICARQLPRFYETNISIINFFVFEFDITLLAIARPVSRKGALAIEKTTGAPPAGEQGGEEASCSYWIYGTHG